MKDPLKTLVEIDKAANNTDLIKIHRQRSWGNAKCANCSLDVDVKTLSDAEYKISALCLECQKEFFKEQDEH
tara:strand:- start:420 stop:635 length:216 start_codon:yes stop_codon:yes gene_type:complete